MQRIDPNRKFTILPAAAYFSSFNNAFASTGLLCPGNVHSADVWRDVLEPVVELYRERDLRRYSRADAAFASPDIYEFLKADGFLYAVRFPTNPILQKSIAQLLTSPVLLQSGNSAGSVTAIIGFGAVLYQ